ncbi:FAD-dependent monooxygenase [Micromonospora olivasterospora]|uniref:2-polyprenyl-6-methoxyphenol hydroxylase-like FAD-dependent oxidoreductase n=1 Tax=Micromonospora olivasterospora TaxID=1880 RepID=A0A562IF37_MICOL|nr:FAD-dependent monooxygenase [Micromonospora olivasterospora]TWH69343.1 2-polyprenyl-6-methoxyphenol hydroxylase-like FAD-dependent oxidoreductase [Micromonospora olivasterospora]
MTQTDVLVVGAGPTGLTLACDLARRGVAVRVVDRARDHPAGSRGKGLSPRSLEVFDDLGVIGRLLATGVTHLPHRKYRGAEVVAEIDPEAGRVPTPDVPYPTGLLVPQWRVEQILRERLADFGVAVELGAELRRFSQHADGVTATVGEAQIRARYLVGCDGGRSTVRKGLGLSLRGHTPDVQLMAVGDVEVDGLGRDAWHQWFTGDGAIMLCPLPGTDAFQVQASHEVDRDGSPLEPTLERFQQTFDRVAGVPGVRLHSLTWRSSYRVNVRMVDQLRVGRVFLAGDAAHVHPIAGGLGMNTGIQDAYNLGWKLGLVLGGAATSGLLDTYEEERLPIAGWLLDITSKALDAVLAAIRETGGGVDAAASRDLTQLMLAYPWSRLSRDAARPDADDHPGGPAFGGRPTGPRAGDRAPDAPLRDAVTGSPTRLFDLYRGPHFTLLGLGERCAAALGDGESDIVKPYLVGPGGLLDDEGHAARAYGGDALVLVRPDGHIGLVADPADAGSVAGYLRSL